MHKAIERINAAGGGDPYSGSGGAPHTILNAAGTELEQRTKMKYGEGFNATDDSTNKVTNVFPNFNVLAKQSEVSDVILTGDKPSSAIAEGKFFVDKNGLLRVATSSIGTTDDVDNTNSTVKSIGEVLGELNSKLSQLVKSGTFTATTSANGTIQTDIPLTTPIVSVYSSGGWSISEISPITTEHRFILFNESGSVPSSQSVTLTYMYLDI